LTSRQSHGDRIILADLGGGAERVTHAWFDQMYAPMAERGIVFTAVGLITADPASVESVLTWADRLQRRVAYLIGENETDAPTPPLRTGATAPRRGPARTRLPPR
jgi:hypothetical protein